MHRSYEYRTHGSSALLVGNQNFALTTMASQVIKPNVLNAAFLAGATETKQKLVNIPHNQQVRKIIVYTEKITSRFLTPLQRIFRLQGCIVMD